MREFKMVEMSEEGRKIRLKEGEERMVREFKISFENMLKRIERVKMKDERV